MKCFSSPGSLGGMKGFLSGMAIAIVMLAGTPASSTAASHYIRSGALGRNDGSDWNNAWTSLTAIPWRRGDTYYIAGGSYSGGVTITTAESGASWITLKKANAADNETVPGWDAAFATTQAVINGKLWVYNGYFEIDGVTGAGISGHGIRIFTPTSESGVIYFSSNASPHHVHHVEVRGPGYAYGSTDSDGIYYNSAAAGSKGLHISNCWIHEIPRNGITTGNIVGTSYADYGMLFENNVLGETGGLGIAYPDKHGQGMQLSYARSNAYTIIRNNIFRNIRGSGSIVFMDGGASHRESMIYNNVFYVTDLPLYDASSPGIITILPDASSTADRIFIYNNTFYSIGSPSVTAVKAQVWGKLGATNVELRNNLWFNSNFTTQHYQITSRSNNAYYRDTGAGVPTGEPYQVTESVDPFVNSSGHDFHLKATALAKDRGSNLSALFSTDIEGNPRPSSGAWSIGAYQYSVGSGGGDTTPPAAPANFRVQP